ncbi:MAG TPA: hypothetical protein VNQ32_13825 [Steroidobacteraceae bacterium]|nr:hypothetical protein [Steroidobacteraceae bacterium]
MKKNVLSLLIHSPLLATAGESALYRTTINMASGRPLTVKPVTIVEVDRTTNSSIVEVAAGPDAGELVSSAALRGLCGLARHRGERYIQARQISQAPATFEVTFPKVGTDSSTPPTSAMAPNVFPVSSCPPSP